MSTFPPSGLGVLIRKGQSALVPAVRVSAPLWASVSVGVSVCWVYLETLSFICFLDKLDPSTVSGLTHLYHLRVHHSALFETSSHLFLLVAYLMVSELKADRAADKVANTVDGMPGRVLSAAMPICPGDSFTRTFSTT